MIPLKPTVKRDLSLWSVLAWRSGYPYPAVFHYDGQLVHFYPPAEEFKRFKEVTMPEVAGDDAKFAKLNREFLENVQELRRRLDAFPQADLHELATLVRRVMSFYVMVVSDKFIQWRPEAWDSRLASEGILYETDEGVEQLVAAKLAGHGLDPKLAHVLTVDEAADALENGANPPAAAQARLLGYVLDGADLLTGVDFAEHCRRRGYENPEAAIQKSACLTGQTGGPGLVRGRVRIVRSREDLPRLRPGEVLVAVMTNANYVPYMRKSSAVVTDEGGRTCHAAIAARELGKPCVVGTLNATSVLKDGDLVEVDADHGLVKIIP